MNVDLSTILLRLYRGNVSRFQSHSVYFRQSRSAVEFDQILAADRCTRDRIYTAAKYTQRGWSHLALCMCLAPIFQLFTIFIDTIAVLQLHSKSFESIAFCKHLTACAPPLIPPIHTIQTMLYTQLLFAKRK